MIVAVTGELVMVLGGISCDQLRQMVCWSSDRAGQFRPRVNECSVVIRVVYTRARMLARSSVRRLVCWSSQASFRNK